MSASTELRSLPPVPKKVLVAVDGEPASERALQHALGLARAFGAHVHIYFVTAVGWSFQVVDFQTVRKQEIEAGQRVLKQAELQARQMGVEATTVLQDSAAGEALGIEDGIIGAVKEIRPELVFMGAHVHTKAERLLSSSVHELILNETRVPALLFRETPPSFEVPLPPYLNILLPFNGGDCAINALRYALTFAKYTSGARITLLYWVQAAHNDAASDQQAQKVLQIGTSWAKTVGVTAGTLVIATPVDLAAAVTDALTMAKEGYDTMVLFYY